MFPAFPKSPFVKYFLFLQDPSSPRSVQSYSSRENGLDKMPPSRKDGPPQASPTSLASSSSAASPSRGKEPPQVETGASWMEAQLSRELGGLAVSRLLAGC